MRWIIRIVVVLVVFIGAAYAALYQVRPVAIVEPVTRGTFPDAVGGTIIVSAQTLSVQAEVDGRILESELKLGAEVKAGQLLVKIDSSALRIEIERLENDLVAARRRVEIGSPREQDLAAARESLRLAEADFKRGSVASLALDSAKRAARSAEQIAEIEKVRLAQEVATLENNLKFALNRLERMTIFAAVDGKIVEQMVSVSERVSPGTILARIMASDRRVELKVSEEDIAKLEPGQKARVEFQSYPMKRFDAVIEQILPPLELNTQRYSVYLKVDMEPALLQHGMTGQGFVLIAEHPNVLMLPRAALFGGVVFLVRDGRVVEREVQLGFDSTHHVQITSGLEEGDLVVVEEIDALRDGDRVRMKRKASP